MILIKSLAASRANNFDSGNKAKHVLKIATGTRYLIDTKKGQDEICDIMQGLVGVCGHIMI